MKITQQEICIEITRHGAKRMKQRLGIKSERERLAVAQAAYTCGLRECDLHGTSLKFIKSYTHEEENLDSSELVLYRDRIFVFCENRLITVLPYDKVYSRKLELQRACKNKGYVNYSKTCGVA